jgi:uncharacterized membrane protein
MKQMNYMENNVFNIITYIVEELFNIWLILNIGFEKL